MSLQLSQIANAEEKARRRNRQSPHLRGRCPAGQRGARRDAILRLLGPARNPMVRYATIITDDDGREVVSAIGEFEGTAPRTGPGRIVQVAKRLDRNFFSESR